MTNNPSHTEQASPPLDAGDNASPQTPHRSGFVAIMGAPNAGKSSLMNRYLGQKVAIVTSKPQTTRHRILGVLTEPSGQIVFWDTPGVHDSAKALNREMVSMALSALADSDVCLWVVDGLRQGPEHQKMLELVCAQKDLPVLAAINKADLMTPTDLDVLSSSLKDSTPAVDVLTISAKTGRGLRKLKRALIPLLPLSPPLFDGETLTDQSLRAIAAEYIREAVFELTHKEIPYSTAVTIDSFAEPDPTDLNPLCRISATVHVERDSQKKVMIGHRGQMLKAIGQTARLRLEDFLEMRVFLSLFVRITKDWSANERALSEFGYLDRH